MTDAGIYIQRSLDANPLREPVLGSVIQSLGLPFGSHGLDAGCGIGLQALLLAEGLSFSSHAAVIAGFGKTFAKPQRLDSRFHRYLIDAQDIRNLGDYGVGTGVSRAQLTDLLAWSDEFLAAATAFLEANAAPTAGTQPSGHLTPDS